VANKNFFCCSDKSAKRINWESIMVVSNMSWNNNYFHTIGPWIFFIVPTIWPIFSMKCRDAICIRPESVYSKVTNFNNCWNNRLTVIRWVIWKIIWPESKTGVENPCCCSQELIYNEGGVSSWPWMPSTQQFISFLNDA